MHQYVCFLLRICCRMCRSGSEQQIGLVWCVCEPPRQCHHNIPGCQRYSMFLRALWFLRAGQHFPQTDVHYATTEAMAMGKFHKDIGNLIVQSAEDAERSDSQVIKVRAPKCACTQSTVVRNVASSLTWQLHVNSQDISVKTKEILANLVALADECEDSKISLEGLKQHHFPPATENFLFHLAAAEQLLRIWACFQTL